VRSALSIWPFIPYETRILSQQHATDVSSLESSYFIYNDLNHFARALFLKPGNRIQFYPRRWDMQSEQASGARERIFARMTAELLYANAGAERLSNNFTAARCT
jgi:hypothetical protein